MGRLFALLVGIDAYEPPVRRLAGCRADTVAAAALLGELCPDADILTLLDEQATRSAFVDAIGRHLGRAEGGDTALLWYSGHGSHRRTSRRAGLAPQGQDQTLVLFDSRAPNSSDLVDGELGELVASVAAGGAHVVVILDCCHSGSGTRDPFDIAASGTDIRQAPPDERVITEPVAEVHEGPPAGAEPHPAGWMLGVGRHVLLAACQSHQTAKEVTGASGARRGAMSVALEEVLRGSAGAPLPTYRDLMSRVDRRVRTATVEQSPVLEVSQDQDAHLPFLGGVLRSDPPHYLTRLEGGTWVVEAGSWHGLSADGVASTALRIHEADSDLSDSSAAVALAEVVGVTGSRGRLRLLEGTLDATAEYWAVVDRLAVPLMRVNVPDERVALEVAASALLTLVETDAQAVVTGNGPWTVTDLRRDPASYPPHWAATTTTEAVELLEQMARWHHVVALDNPQTRLSHDDIDVTVELFSPEGAGRVTTDASLDLPYVDGLPQSFTISLRNRTSRTLWVTVLDAGDDYRLSSADLTPGNLRRLEPGEVWTVADGALIDAVVPDHLWQAGVTTRTSVVEMVVSTGEFDPFSLTQPGVSVEEFTRARSALQVGQRQAADWTTRTLRVVARRQPPSRSIGTAPVEVVEGVTVDGHPSFAARVSLSSLTAADRDDADPLLPCALADDPWLSGPFSLSTARGEQSLDVVVLTDVVAPESVTPDQPLLIHVAGGVPPEEHVVVLGWQDGVCIPVGFGNGTGNVVIERIPDAVDTRSLTGAVRLLLRKFARSWVGAPQDTVRLAVAGLDDTGQATYDDDPYAVADAVRSASRTAVVMHGIIGDTRGMIVGCLRGDTDGPGLGDRYDLVLAVDYENIHTTIDQTASQLLGKLTAAGVSAQNPVDLVVHSMGGLVARWLIEVLDGGPLVNRLVMLGTPNSGSPWARVQDVACTLLTLGLNKIAVAAWPAAIFGALLSAVERVDNALDDMTPRSERLKSLAEAQDPAVPYVAVAGSTSLLPPNERTGIARVVRALSHRAATLVALGFDNDIAVVVESAHAVPHGRLPAPELRVIGCDHMSYFSSVTGLAALRAAVTTTNAASDLSSGVEGS